MENIKRNLFGFLQAAISFLIILCAFFPYVDDFIQGSDLKIPAITSFTFFFTQETYTGDKETHIGAFFVAFIMLQVLNIFVQTKKNIGLSAIVTSLFGLIPIILLNNFIKDLEIEIGRHIFKYQFGFYFIVILMAMQILVQLGALFAMLSNQDTEAYAIQSDETGEPTKPAEPVNSYKYEVTPTPKPEPALEPELALESTPEPEIEPAAALEPKPAPQVLEPTLDSELGSLRAEAEALRAAHERMKAEEEKARLEKERLERERLEKERIEEELRIQKARAEQLEKERIEKENLKKEIEELKKLLQRQKENLESNQ